MSYGMLISKVFEFIKWKFVWFVFYVGLESTQVKRVIGFKV